MIRLPKPAIVKPVELWTGKQLISLAFRPNDSSKAKVNLRVRGKNYAGSGEEFAEGDNFLVLHNSQLMAGVLDKATIGSGGKLNVFYALLKDYGKEASCLAMYRLASITSKFLMNRGFSIGIGDVYPGIPLLQAKKDLVMKGYTKCFELLSQPEETDGACEGAILKELSDIREKAGKVCVRELSKFNAPLLMAQSGSKGSYINISQMVACVGQQAINGHRVDEGFQDRTLPYFPRGAKGPDAKGFVANSFFSGLTPCEFYFHAMGGREGLVDTAVKTAETGYMQRRLVKALEDLCCFYDMTVRNADGYLVQLYYGEDGLDPMHIEDKQNPVDFLRVYLTTNATYTDRRSPYLLEKEKRTHLETMKNSSRIGYNKVSSGFERDLEKFVLSNSFRSEQLVHFLDECWLKFQRATMEPGTAVGA